MIRAIKTTLVLQLILLILVIVESLAVIEQVLYPNYQIFILGPLSLSLSTSLFWALAPLSVLALLIVIFIDPIRYFLDIGSRKSRFISRFHAWIDRPFSRLMRRLTMRLDNHALPRNDRLSLLVLTILASIFVGLLPYRSDLNPTGALVGIDTSHYADVLSTMLGMNAPTAIHYSFVEPWFGGSRPVAFLFLYTIAVFTGTGGEGALRLAPALLTSMLSISTYIFVRSGLGNTRAAVLTSLFSVASYQVSIGIWAGYLANWLALIETYLLLTIFLLYIAKREKRFFAGTSILSIILLFTHPWTWIVIITTMGLLLVDRLLRSGREMFPSRPMIILFSANVLVDFVRTLLVGSYGGGDAGYDIARTATPLDFAQIWPKTLSIFSYYDGYLANSVYLGLALLAVVGLYRARDMFSRLLVLWTGLIALPFLFLNSILETRLVFVAPISILTVIGLLKIEIGQARSQSMLLTVFVFLLGLNATLQAVLHLVAIPG